MHDTRWTIRRFRNVLAPHRRQPALSLGRACPRGTSANRLADSPSGGFHEADASISGKVAAVIGADDNGRSQARTRRRRRPLRFQRCEGAEPGSFRGDGLRSPTRR